MSASTPIYLFCAFGTGLVLFGLLHYALTLQWAAALPWFAPVILGIVFFTVGLTFKDAQENDAEE